MRGIEMNRGVYNQVQWYRTKIRSRLFVVKGRTATEHRKAAVRGAASVSSRPFSSRRMSGVLNYRPLFGRGAPWVHGAYVQNATIAIGAPSAATWWGHAVDAAAIVPNSLRQLESETMPARQAITSSAHHASGELSFCAWSIASRPAVLRPKNNSLFPPALSYVGWSALSPIYLRAARLITENK